MFNQPGESDIMIAFQVPTEQGQLHVMTFNDAIVGSEAESACMTPFVSKSMTTPHSTTMVDFDGDCMVDLFVTVQSGGKNYYETYIRRERGEAIELEESQSTKRSAPGKNGTAKAIPKVASSGTLKGLGSFCLVDRQELPSSTGNLV